MTIIATQSLVKHYGRGKKEVSGLAGVDLNVSKGDYVALVGPSGSGKTTLLLSLGGLIRPTSGKVVIDGTSIYDLKPAARIELRRSKIGFLFQTFNLIPYLTALQNTQMPLMIAGKSREEQEEVAKSTLERVGLGNRLHHKPSELSIGQQQRVALARTLANNPEIILADEPTGNLDPATVDSVADMLRELNNEGITIVMVTHDPRMADHARRVTKLVEGRLVEDADGNGHRNTEPVSATKRPGRPRVKRGSAATATQIVNAVMKEDEMPVYEYSCQDCGAKTDVKASIEEKSKGLDVRCEACGSPNVRQVFGGIDILSPSSSSSDSGGCCGGGGCCG